MNERAAWILSLLLLATVGWYRLAALDAVRAAEMAAYTQAMHAQRETISALRSSLRDAKTITLAAHKARQDCEEGLGLSALRHHWLDKQLGLTERREAHRSGSDVR